MTDAIIVAIISGSFTLICGVVVALISRDRRNNEQKISRQQNNEPSMAPKELTAPTFVEKQTLIRDESLQSVQVASLLHKQIEIAILNVPPFKQEKVREAFIGAVIFWHGHLMSVFDRGNSICATLELVENRCVVLSCNAHPKDCAALEFAPKDAVIAIRGRIRRVSEFNAELDDCTFTAEASTSAPPQPKSGFYTAVPPQARDIRL